MQTVYDPFNISCYNVFYTSLPVIALGILEQDVCDALSIRYPRLYEPGFGHSLFNPRAFAVTALQGVTVSVVVFFVPLGKMITRQELGKRTFSLMSYSRPHALVTSLPLLILFFF